MKTLTFTNEEIEMLCRGVLAIPDDGEDLTPRIALHKKLTQKTVRYLQFDDSARKYVERGLQDLSDLDDVHLASMVEQGMPVSDYVAEKARRESAR